MPLRIRKTFTLFPGVKVNVSKGGTSITVGKKGVHLNFSKRGVRETVGLPGSGISETNYLFKNDSKDEDKKEAKKEEHVSETDSRSKRHSRRSAQEHASSPWGFLLFVLLALFFIYFGASALGLLPPNLLTNFLQTLAHLARQARL
jgi:uncharacterized protein DUF4236